MRRIQFQRKSEREKYCETMRERDRKRKRKREREGGIKYERVVKRHVGR